MSSFSSWASAAAPTPPLHPAPARRLRRPAARCPPRRRVAAAGRLARLHGGQAVFQRVPERVEAAGEPPPVNRHHEADRVLFLGGCLVVGRADVILDRFVDAGLVGRQRDEAVVDLAVGDWRQELAGLVVAAEQVAGVARDEPADGRLGAHEAQGDAARQVVGIGGQTQPHRLKGDAAAPGCWIQDLGCCDLASEAGKPGAVVGVGRPLEGARAPMTTLSSIKQGRVSTPQCCAARNRRWPLMM